jgi:leucyl aminopeptidase
LNFPLLASSEKSRVAYTVLTPEMGARAQNLAHAMGRCGSFEVLPAAESASIQDINHLLTSLEARVARDDVSARGPRQIERVPVRAEITKALESVDANRIREMMTWLSSYPDRYNRGDSPNAHIQPFVDRLEALRATGARTFTVETIAHSSTAQKSVHLTLPGTDSTLPSLVFGAHLDSINQGWFGGAAPGADDNASGSATIFEALRVLLTQPALPRTLEFFWYAGEESGLLGSAEIARSYKEQGKKVLAVLQLDMTAFPGAGTDVLGSATDFTTPWLRELVVSLNDNYLHLKVENFECGYGCSDHASWYRQGYDTVIPFEATMSTMNHRLHTAEDVMQYLNVDHSAQFAKLAVAMGMELGANHARSANPSVP